MFLRHRIWEYAILRQKRVIKESAGAHWGLRVRFNCAVQKSAGIGPCFSAPAVCFKSFMMAIRIYICLLLGQGHHCPSCAPVVPMSSLRKLDDARVQVAEMSIDLEPLKKKQQRKQ